MISFLYGIPNIVISSPFNSIEAGNLLYTAFLKKIPTFIRYSKNTLEYRKEEYKELEIGSWEILSKGKEAYLISYGDMLNIALKVKELLLKDNIDIEIINARYIKPFDQKLLKKIAKTNKKIFVLEEVIENNSLSSNLINYLIKNKLKSNIIAYNLPNEFIKEGNRKIILEKCELDEMSIYKKIKEELKNAKKNNY